MDSNLKKKLIDVPFPSYIYLRKKSGFSNVLWRQHTTLVKIDAELLVFTSVEIAQLNWDSFLTKTCTRLAEWIEQFSIDFSVFTRAWSKLKIVTIQWIKSRIWDAIDDWYINNLVKNQVSAVFHSRVICRSVSPKFIELCMETPCLCPSEGHKHGGHKVTETSVTEFCYWNEKLLP